VTVPAAGTASQSTRLFAGAKESALLGEYEDAGVTMFVKAISWGWFEIVEKPLLWLLRTPNPWVLGALFSTLALTASGVELSALPREASNAGQLFIGVALGIRFTPEFARAAPRWLASVALGTLAVDPRKDFTYIARTSGQTFGIAVPANSRFKTLQDFVAAAKAKPGSITYAHAGVGGATHVGMEEFAAAAGIQLSHVPYKGGAEALQGVLGGHVDALADSSSWAPHVEAGKLRLLATWGEQRTPRFKDVPTLKDLGYNVVVDAPNGIGAPKGLPPAVEAKLRDAFRQAVASPEFKSVADRLDAPLLYLDGPDYAKYVNTVYQKETVLIDKLKLRDLMR
jgi:tripartite-type tricarboxylate transporter receptor subunit TctC